MSDSNKKIKLVALISHPIQYFTPLYQEIAKLENIDFKVYFCSDMGTKPYLDKGFGKEIKFDIPLLEGYKYEFLENLSPFKNKDGFLKFINLGILKKLLNKEIDVLWIHGWNSLTNILAVVIANYLKIPILLRADSNIYIDSHGVKLFLKRIILGKLFKIISYFLYCGTVNKLFYKKYGASDEKMIFVPYAINNNFFISKYENLKDKKIELRRKYNLPIDLPIILFSGKLINVKNSMDLLKAFEKLTNEIPSVLVFLGDGILRNELENYVRDKNIQNVFFLGFRNQSELPEIFSLSDIFILPSSFEQWGLVVNEAMCFNLPVIVSDKVGSGYDLVKENLNGFIFPSGDIESLYQKLKILANDPAKRISFGNESKKIISKWSFDECIKGLLEGL